MMMTLMMLIFESVIIHHTGFRLVFSTSYGMYDVLFVYSHRCTHRYRDIIHVQVCTARLRVGFRRYDIVLTS